MSPPGFRLPNQHHFRWPDTDIERVLFRCAALGYSEDASMSHLRLCEAQQVRRLRAFVDGMSDADLERRLHACSAETEARGFRSSSVIQLRSRIRWPWRTHTGATPARSIPTAGNAS